MDKFQEGYNIAKEEMLFELESLENSIKETSLKIRKEIEANCIAHVVEYGEYMCEDTNMLELISKDKVMQILNKYLPIDAL